LECPVTMANQYAVIESGGKQHRVKVGQRIKIEKLEGEPGSAVKFDKVLMCAQDEDIKVGAPYLSGGEFFGEILDQGRHKKITILKFKRRKKYRRKQGHRQHFTEVVIKEIKAA